MSAPVALRGDFTARDLRRLAKASKDAAQSRRLLALAEIYAGGARSDAAEIGDVGLQVIRDWVLRFNAEGPAGIGGGRRARSDPGDPWRGALAAYGPAAMDLARVRHLLG